MYGNNDKDWKIKKAIMDKESEEAHNRWRAMFPEHGMEWKEFEQWELENYPYETSYGDLEIVQHVCDNCGKLKPCKSLEDPFEDEMAHEGEKVGKKWLCQPCHHELSVEV